MGTRETVTAQLERRRLQLLLIRVVLEQKRRCVDPRRQRPQVLRIFCRAAATRLCF